ncbi:MAG TPA: SDR family oxidoreductase [Jiangellales bacterium]|nr:SDR family oxidoreductase [Jiangellales bacterium]
MRVAVVTGASKGLGRALAEGLADHGWALVIDARGAEDLGRVRDGLADTTRVVAITGDITDPRHRARLAAEAAALGGAGLLVNNASDLGPSPLPHLVDYPIDALRRVFEVDVLAPLAMVQELRVQLVRHGGTVLNISSDAAVEAYAGWGGYGAAKAALDQLTAVLAVEEPRLRALAVDPGDLRTEMHQRAHPGEDISDRPVPESVVPHLLALLTHPPAGVRHRVADVAEARA